MQKGKPTQFKIYGVRNIQDSTDKIAVCGNMKILDKPCQVRVVSHWCDQLQGPKTAQTFLQLLRGGNVVEEQDLFGIFDRGEDLKYLHWNDLRDVPVVS